MEILGKSDKVAGKLKEYIDEVQIGDKTLREAQAAKVYFNELMGKSFSRGNDDILLNSGLNYGYTIIRSYLARLCVGYGLNSQLGIHHKNEYNRFNLVDDLIEPIRPIVDIMAYKLLDGEEIFTIEHRHEIVKILDHTIKYKNQKMYISNMLDDYVSQYSSYVEGKIDKIIFPTIEDYR